ncbi:MAG TPA: extracellular solute-binding protein [Chloroflexota bacterium]|nr:extracellular solute-binding protein [Chloroflexota bacterium]
MRQVRNGSHHTASGRGITRRGLAMASAALGAGGVIAACGAAAEAPQKRVRTTPYTVRFMALSTNPWMLEQIERFNKEVGPESKVQVAPEPQPDQAALWTKFQSTLAAGDVPDVARLKEIWVFEAAAKNAVASLDGYFKTDKDFNAADLLPLYQDNFKYKGQNYAVAREVSIIIGYYNKANFASAGLDPEKPPTTYEEFRQYAQRLTKQGATPTDTTWGFDPYEYGTREFVLLWLLLHMRRYGLEFWNRDKTAVALNTPGHVEVMQFFMDMIHKDRSAVPPDAGISGGAQGAPQTTMVGKIAMWEQGTWDLGVNPLRYPDLRFGVFLWPKKANQQHVALAGSSAMTKGSKDPDAAWEFIRWWNTPQNQVGWYENAGGNAPSRKSVYAKAPFAENATWKTLVPFVTGGGGATQPRPMAERYTELAESMTPALMRGLRNQTPAREALDEATRVGSAFWKDIGGNASKAL